MEFSVLVALILSAGALVFLAIGGVFLLSARRRPSSPPVSGPAPDAAWNAEVLGAGVVGRLGGTLASSFGVLRLDRGVLSFVADGDTTASWSYPCAQLSAVKADITALDGADVRLRGPMGELRCNVSAERINRLTRNPFKDLRERGYADQFLMALAAHGTRIG